MSPRVAVLTASMPERAPMLAEAIASVAAQTYPPKMHHIGIDHAREGAAVVYNRLARTVGCCVEWLCFLDDDDLYHPDHLEVLGANATPDTDVVYSRANTEGIDGNLYDGTAFDAAALEDRCTVPITAMVRLKWFEKVGGFPGEHAYDWGLWKNLARAGARFHALPDVTWTYRIGDPRGGGNRSWMPEGAMP